MLRKITIAAAMAAMLAGCDAPPDTIAGKVQDAVLKVCAFRADYTWLLDVVKQSNITVQMVDGLVLQICSGVEAARGGIDGSQSLMGGKDCPNGSIVVNDEEVCIEGVDEAPKDDK
jgi:hypothetical protein